MGNEQEAGAQSGVASLVITDDKPVLWYRMQPCAVPCKHAVTSIRSPSAALSTGGSRRTRVLVAALAACIIGPLFCGGLQEELLDLWSARPRVAAARSGDRWRGADVDMLCGGNRHGRNGESG